MAYVAVKGGTKAIEESIKRLKYERLKKRGILNVKNIESGMRGMIDQVMSESSIYSEELASLAIKHAEGSSEEAVFLLRAFRSTLPRKHYSIAVESEDMIIERRISASFKDIPGGQILGASYDYTHRLIDFSLINDDKKPNESWDWLSKFLNTKQSNINVPSKLCMPKVLQYLRDEGLLLEFSCNNDEPKDVTKQSLKFPSTRSERLQILTRGQTGAVTALGYASLRGYGSIHPTVGELRVGKLPVYISNPLAKEESDLDGYYIGDIKVTEVETLIPITVKNRKGDSELKFEVGYGICYGQNETKAIAMSILDQCLEQGDNKYPTHDEEFVLMHIDSVEATGFISHLKLPHYVTFQSKLDSVRKTQKENDKNEIQL